MSGPKCRAVQQQAPILSPPPSVLYWQRRGGESEIACSPRTKTRETTSSSADSLSVGSPAPARARRGAVRRKKGGRWRCLETAPGEGDAEQSGDSRRQCSGVGETDSPTTERPHTVQGNVNNKNNPSYKYTAQNTKHSKKYRKIYIYMNWGGSREAKFPLSSPDVANTTLQKRHREQSTYLNAMSRKKEEERLEAVRYIGH